MKGAAAMLLAALVVGSCSGPILANPPAAQPTIARPTPRPVTLADPQPVVLPRDDGPHERLTEWWYYTGHLVGTDGRRLGFEAVTFRAERGFAPVTWASHLALTDEAGGRFLYGQRAEIGSSVDRSPLDGHGAPTGFALAMTGFDPLNPAISPAEPWILAGGGGQDTIRASLSPSEAAQAGGAFGLDLILTATRPATLHGRIGWIDFGQAGSSYYYSRTSMSVQGSVDLDGSELPVAGTAWFDHQWGDFISVGGGGWDWFAVNLADGTDLTVSLVRASDGSYALAYGTLVDPSGTATHLDSTALSIAVDPGRTWSSPATGATYPAGWTIEVPGEQLVIHLRPTVDDQELDTRATTGVVYWEGSQIVSATRDGEAIGGEAYVELTGYAPATP